MLRLIPASSKLVLHQQTTMKWAVLRTDIVAILANLSNTILTKLCETPQDCVQTQSCTTPTTTGCSIKKRSFIPEDYLALEMNKSLVLTRQRFDCFLKENSFPPEW